MSRIVAYNRSNVAIGVYKDLNAASAELGLSRHEIGRNLRGLGPKYIKDLRFGYEVTNKELRKARLEDRKNRQAQKQKELEKWFK